MTTLITAALMLALVPFAASAQRSLTLGSTLSAEGGTFLKHLLPRFSLKASIRVAVVPLEDSTATVQLVEDDGGGGTPVFSENGGATYLFRILTPSAEADRLEDWLTSEVGRNTILAYAPDDGAGFAPPGQVVAEVEVAAPTGDVVQGEKLAMLHCGRCHVVSDKNKFGGIGSTPSFAALRTIEGWEDKFAAFWTLNPHPAFTQVAEMTEPFDPSRPPPIAPLELTLEDVEAIAAFAATIPPKDLGAPLAFQ